MLNSVVLKIFGHSPLKLFVLYVNDVSSVLLKNENPVYLNCLKRVTYSVKDVNFLTKNAYEYIQNKTSY